MPCNVAFNNLQNGQIIHLPYDVSGTITVLPSAPAAQLIAVSKQIDDNPLQDIAGSCLPPLPTGAAVAFNFELTAMECPLPATFYMLTIYCWDDQSAQVTVASVTFQTAGAMPPPMPPTPPPTPPVPPPIWP